ncbi:GDSL-type esterase/lipase family protein [bacterium]|nr:GDSL-type esterase/lipase family protein [bacterium]
MRNLLTFIVALLFCGAPIHATEWEGERSSFHGFDQYDFKLSELKCKIVTPHAVAEGTPWIWRARFWGHQPGVDIALLEKGFHVAYVDVADLFGSPKAVARWDIFYDYLTTKKGFSKKPALEGMSRGGLIVYNWTAKNPEKVSCIYADAPVCDFKSWPSGKGTSKGAPKSWKQCLKAYGFTEAEAMAYDKNPLDNLAAIAMADVPLLHVVGDVDKIVPLLENTAVLEKRYLELGGRIEVIHKAKVGHHPHGLKDPSSIVEFILKYATSVDEPIRVACVGDSITYGASIKGRANNCYPAQLQRLLGKAYEVQNFGVNGATLLKKGNNPYWRTKRFKPAHAFNPDIVVIKLGSNDSKPDNWRHKDNFVDDYVALIESFRALPSKPVVYICKPVPAFPPGNSKITDPIVRGEVIPLIQEVAEKAKVEVIDLYVALSDRADLFPDKVHPNAKGAGVIAQTIFTYVKSINITGGGGPYEQTTILSHDFIDLPVTDGLFLDLDANAGVELEEVNRVKAWHNQVKGNVADVFVKQDEGRKQAGSGRPTLKSNVSSIGGNNTLIFEEQELIHMDEDAFDHMTQGSGHTWFSVMSVYEQRVGKKDVNSFFGNLRNGNPYDGFWGSVMDDNAVWIGARNGFKSKQKGKPKMAADGKGTPGLWDAKLNPRVWHSEPLDENRYYLVMGRMGAGAEVVDLELFINSATPVDSKPVPVNSKANPSKMAVGQERDAINHPGKESFHGEIARFLIYERPLSNMELTQMTHYLARSYQIKISDYSVSQRQALSVRAGSIYLQSLRQNKG